MSFGLCKSIGVDNMVIYYTPSEGSLWNKLVINTQRSKIIKTLNRNHFFESVGKRKWKGIKLYNFAFSILKGIEHSPVVHSVKMGKYIWDSTFKGRRP